MSKYHSKKVKVGGEVFDSQEEYRRFCDLCLLQKAGKITDLQRQVKYELIPAQYQEYATGEVYQRGERKGQPKIKRVCVEKSVCYYADFVYYENGKKVVEDVKSSATEKKESYIIKRKLLLWVHGIKLREYKGEAQWIKQHRKIRSSRSAKNTAR